MPSGKLWRKLGATAPVFEATATSFGTRDDHTIHGVTITHGTGKASGLSVSTVKLDVVGSLPVTRNWDQLTFGLTDYGNTLIESIVGPDTETGFPNAPARGRFAGRIAGIDVNDRGDARPDMRLATLSAATYTATLTVLERPAIGLPALPNVGDIYAALLENDALPGADNLTPNSNLPDTNYAAEANIPATTVTGELMDGIGVLFRSPRGQLGYQAWDTATRIFGAAVIASDYTVPSLLRRHCESPVTWSLPITLPTGVVWHAWHTDGTTWDGIVLPDGTGQAQWPRIEELDLTHCVLPDGFPIEYIATARVRRSSPTRYGLNTLKVDLSRLLASGDPEDAATAGMLLRLDVGDPLKLGYDWPDQVSGVVFVSRITERITPDTWSLDLDVMPTEQVTGSESPTVSGGTWDTAWPASATWDTVPDYQTWDTI